MRKYFFITIFFMFTATIFAEPNVQVVTESYIPLPLENTPYPRGYINPAGDVPLVPKEGGALMIKPAPIPLTSPETAIITTPPPIPLTPPDEPRMLPSTTVSLDQYAFTTLHETNLKNEYRIVNMQLNDFGVAMARRAGLNYIYNPAVRGSVNGTFQQTDPIYMLHMAAKANGYKLVIKDGILAEFQKTTPQK